MRRGHVWLIVAVLASAAMPAGALAKMQGAPGDEETQQQWEQRGHARDARVPPRTEEETPPVSMDGPGKDPGTQGDDPGAASGETGASMKDEHPRRESDAERQHREWVESIWSSP